MKGITDLRFSVFVFIIYWIFFYVGAMVTGFAVLSSIILSAAVSAMFTAFTYMSHRRKK